MSKKIIMLTDEEFVDILVALDDKLQAYKELRAGYEGSPEYVSQLKWCQGNIKRMQELYQKILKTPPSD